MRFLSLFSGIEAASVAWKPLGWQCVGVAEIDPFPCAVLRHHYPDVPNLGSVTDITDEQIAALGPIDLVVGGSPCQDLSVAGKRAGLAGERSGLFHEQLRIFHAARHLCGARYLLWENVPGAFSSNKGLDFAVVVGTMAGLELDVPSDGWGTEGVALGEHGLVEWAVLDAQWFGVAQRRRRVFALLDVGDWSSRPPILLERDSLRGDSPPRRETGEGVAGTAGGGPDGGRLAGTVSSKWAKGTGGPAGDECYNLVAHTLRSMGHDGSHANGGGQVAVAFGWQNSASQGDSASEFITPTLDKSKTPAVAVSLRGREGGGTAELGDEVQNCLRASGGGGDKPHVLIFQDGENGASTQESNARTPLRELREAIGEEAFAEWGLGILDSLQPSQVLRQAVHGLGIRLPTFSRSWVVCCALGSPFSSSEGAVQSLREARRNGCTSSGWEPSEQLARELGAYLSELSQPGAQAERFMRDLRGACEGIGVLRQALSAVQEARKRDDGEGKPAQPGFAVRRLVPEECEFLQGFPRGYTAIPWRKKPADQCPDGPRYKTLGNSMAVPVMRWIGRQIELASERT